MLSFWVHLASSSKAWSPCLISFQSHSIMTSVSWTMSKSDTQWWPARNTTGALNRKPIKSEYSQVRRQESRFISISDGLTFPHHVSADLINDTFILKFDVDVRCFDLTLCITRDGGEKLLCHQTNDIHDSSRFDIKTFPTGLSYKNLCGNLSFAISLRKRGQILVIRFCSKHLVHCTHVISQSCFQ